MDGTAPTAVRCGSAIVGDVLDELFKALLDKLMTGEIRVTDLDLSALEELQPAVEIVREKAGSRAAIYTFADLVATAEGRVV